MRALIPLATIAIVSLTPAPATAQRNMSDADTREVLAYRLTMPKLKQLDQALADLARQRDADPAYQELLKKKKELAALSEKDNPTEAELERMARLEEEIAEAETAEEGEEDIADQSLSDLAARMAADPRIAAALQRSGLTPREAAVMQFALFQAGLASEMLASGTIKEIPKDVNAENVRFYQAHKAEIAALKALSEREER